MLYYPKLAQEDSFPLREYDDYLILLDNIDVLSYVSRLNVIIGQNHTDDHVFSIVGIFTVILTVYAYFLFPLRE